MKCTVTESSIEDYIICYCLIELVTKVGLSTFIEVYVPSYESERACIFILGEPISFLSAILLFNFIEVFVPS